MDAALTVALGAGLGFLIGLTGVGGGALVAPALYVLLGLGYEAAIALSLVYSLVAKIAGAVQHARQGTVRWPLTLLYGVAAVPFGVVGSLLVYAAPPAVRRTFPYVLAALLVLVAALILAEALLARLAARPKPFMPERLDRRAVASVLIVAAVVGLLLGVTSVGSGSLVIVSMLYLFRMPAPEVVGSNLVLALIMVVPAGLTHLAAGGVDGRVLALLLAGGIVGTPLGARVTGRVPERALKLVIAGLVLLGALATLWRAGR